MPLLLGGAIAVLVYMSRASRFDDAGAQPDDPKAHAKAAHNLAIEDAAAVVRAAKDSIAALDAARRRTTQPGTRVEREMDRLGDALRHSDKMLRRTKTACGQAAKSAAVAVDAATAARLPSARLGTAKAQFATVDKHVDEARSALKGVIETLAGQPTDSSAETWKQEAAAIGQRLEWLERDATSAHNVADRALKTARGDRAVPLEGIRRVGYAVLQLAPVAYARRGLNRMINDYGVAPTLGLVALLFALISGVAIVLIHPALVPVLVAAGIILLLICALVGSEQFGIAIVVAALAMPVLAVIGFLNVLDDTWAIAAGVVTLLITWLALGAMDHWPGPAAVAWILFAAIALWSGALAFIGELGASETKLESVVVFQKQPIRAVKGLYLGRSTKAVFLASVAGCNHAGCRRVLAIPDKQITCAVFGPSITVDKGKSGAPAPKGLTGFEEVAPDADEACATPVPTSTSTPPKSTKTIDRSRTSNQLSLLNGIQLVIRRAARVTPPSSNDVRVGPFNVVLGGGVTPTSPQQRKVKLVLDDGVLFRFARAKLTAEGKRKMRAAAAVVRSTHAERVFVAGHTDAVGTRQHNRRLSWRRARAVAVALRTDLAPDPPAIQPHGYGETKPVACNTHRDGTDNWVARAYNRRVEIWTDRAPRYPKLECTT